MMSKYYLLVLLFFSSTLMLAQKVEIKVPNYNKIKTNIENKNSEFFYPKLLQKLEKNDSIITPEQYKHLYYGFTFQKEYAPYKISENETKLSKYFQAQNLSKSDYAEIIKLSNAALKRVSPESQGDELFRIYLPSGWKHRNGKEGFD